MKIALAQINPTIGALMSNYKKITHFVTRAIAEGAHLIIFPELSLPGYIPRDLLERTDFIQQQLDLLEKLRSYAQDIAIVVGAAIPADPNRPQKLHNTAVWMHGDTRYHQAKILLPDYGVFNEPRYFIPGTQQHLVSWTQNQKVQRIGIAICEDYWGDELHYPVNPIASLMQQNPDFLINISASPWHQGKPAERLRVMQTLARHYQRPLIMVNQVGGQDEVQFDGGSFVIDAQGHLLARLSSFQEELAIFNWPDCNQSDCMALTMDASDENKWHRTIRAPAQAIAAVPEGIPALHQGLVMGIRDFYQKIGCFRGVILGLSGGIDSALTAVLAAEALGPERVTALIMPGPFSSPSSAEDALALAKLTQINTRIVDINPIYHGYLDILEQLFGPKIREGLTQQNLQARIRGNLLMAAANEEQRLVLNTSNKSELAMGYSTLYGDLVGGLCVIGDIYKHEVYALARHLNQIQMRIPENSITRAPSAELAPNQKDSDDLPDYDFLDEFLSRFLDKKQPPRQIQQELHVSGEQWQQLLRRLDNSDFKRKQAAPILRVNAQSLGMDRFIPIAKRMETVTT